MSRRRKKLAAFTLVELLVVVAILSMLIAILLPSLAAAKYRARVIACMSRMRGMTVGVLTYTNSNQGYYPDGPHGRRAPEHFYMGNTGSPEYYDLRDEFREYFGTSQLHKLMICPLLKGPWLPKYPVYPDVDRWGQSPYVFYFGQDVHDFNDRVGAHWARGNEMLRVGNKWTPGQSNPDKEFDWLMSDFVYYNGYGGFGGTYMATTHIDAHGQAPPAGSYLDHNLGCGYIENEMGNANFAKADGSVVNFDKVGEDSVWNLNMIGVRRQQTQSYFVPFQ